VQGRPGTRTPAPLEQEHLVHPTGAPVPSFLRCVLCTLGHRYVCRNPCLVWDCAWQLRRMHSLSWLCQRATTDAAARTVLEPCQLNVCMHCADQLNTHHLLCVCSFALHVHSFEMHALCQVGSKSCARTNQAVRVVLPSLVKHASSSQPRETRWPAVPSLVKHASSSQPRETRQQFPAS